MEVAEILSRLQEKVVQGEHGPFTRPFVVIDEDEYRAILSALEEKPKRGRPRKVPNVATR